MYKELTEKVDQLTKAEKYDKALELVRQRKSLVKTLQLGKSQLRDTVTDELFLLSKSRPYLKIPAKFFQSEQDFIYSRKNQVSVCKLVVWKCYFFKFTINWKIFTFEPDEDSAVCKISIDDPVLQWQKL